MDQRLERIACKEVAAISTIDRLAEYEKTQLSRIRRLDSIDAQIKVRCCEMVQLVCEARRCVFRSEGCEIRGQGVRPCGGGVDPLRGTRPPEEPSVIVISESADDKNMGQGVRSSAGQVHRLRGIAPLEEPEAVVIFDEENDLGNEIVGDDNDLRAAPVGRPQLLDIGPQERVDEDFLVQAAQHHHRSRRADIGPSVPRQDNFIIAVLDAARKIVEGEQLALKRDIVEAKKPNSPVMVESAREDAVGRRKAAFNLFYALSDEALARLLGPPDYTRIHVKAEGALQTLAGLAGKSRLQGLLGALVKLRCTFVQVHPNSPFPAFDGFGSGIVLRFLQDVDREAQAKAARQAQDIYEMQGLSVAGREQKRRRVNNGSTAAGDRLSLLSSLVSHDLAQCDIKSAAVQSFRLQKGIPIKARCPTARDVMLLEAAAVAHANPVVRGLAAAEVISCLGSMRARQAGDQDYRAVQKIDGATFLFSEGFRKHPGGRLKQLPYVQVTPADGVVVGPKLLEAFQKMREGAEALGCTFRGYDSKDGDPFKATRFENTRCTDAHLLIAKRALYEHICGYSKDVAATFGVNSARHFMVELMVCRGTPPEDMAQAGQWGDHALADIIPERRAVADRAAVQLKMPYAYAFNAKTLHMCGIKARELSVLREYIQKMKYELPTEDAWEHLRRHITRHPLAAPLPPVQEQHHIVQVSDAKLRALLQQALWLDEDA